MKAKISYILMSMLLLVLASCADEGPYTMGKLDTVVEVSEVTPVSAVITVTIPSDNNLISNESGHPYLYLVDRLPDSSHVSYGEKYEAKFISKENVSGGKRFKYLVGSSDYYNTALTPEETYYVMLSTSIDISGDKEYSMDYYTGYSFTTAKEDDYTALGNVDVTLQASQNGVVIVKINLSWLNFSDKPIVEASKSSGMSDVISGNVLNYTYNTCTVAFTEMEAGTYYFRVKGNFLIVIANEEIRLDDRVVACSNSLTISAADMDNESIAETYLTGENFTIFRFSVPNIGIYTKIGKLTWSSNELKDQPVDGWEYVYESTACYVYALISHKFEKGDKVKFDLTDTFTFEMQGNDQIINISTTDIEVTPSNPLSCETVFAGQDYTLVEINRPKGFWVSSLYYNISSDKNFSEMIKVEPTYNYFLLLGPAIQHDIDYYLRMLGDFSIQNMMVENAIIDPTGKIEAAKPGTYMFNINYEWILDKLRLTVNSPENFLFEKSDYTSLYVYSASDPKSLLFSQEQTNKQSERLEFVIDTQKSDKLVKGESYILKIKSVSMKYNNSTFCDYQDIYLDWKYE